MATPHFTMLWGRDVPRVTVIDEAGKQTAVDVIAGRIADKRGGAPPPRSWAARPDTDVAIWSIQMEPGATWTLPPTKDPHITRTVYFFRGSSLVLEGETLTSHAALVVESDRAIQLRAGAEGVDILVLQGRPIGQPVVQHGPFVMNTRAEIQQAMMDYQRTRFGGWPWPSDAPVHARGHPLRQARGRPGGEARAVARGQIRRRTR